MRVNFLGSDGEHPKTVCGEPLVLRSKRVDVGVIHRIQRATERERHAPREDRLRRTLADDEILASGRPHDNRHDASLKVEWDLVHLGICRNLCVRVGFGMGQYRTVEHVFQAGLKVAVHVCERENLFTLVQCHIAMTFKDHSVHRQRTCLVGA